jgi:hypothetical protein
LYRNFHFVAANLIRGSTNAAKMFCGYNSPTADSRLPRATSILPPRSPARTAGPLTVMRALPAVLRQLAVRPRLLGSMADHAATCRRILLLVRTAQRAVGFLNCRAGILPANSPSMAAKMAALQDHVDMEALHA